MIIEKNDWKLYVVTLEKVMKTNGIDLEIKIEDTDKLEFFRVFDNLKFLVQN